MGLMYNIRVATICLVLIVGIVYLLPSRSWTDREQLPLPRVDVEQYISGPNIETSPSNGTLPLPAAYGSVSAAQQSTGICAERYGTSYIAKFGERVANYCDWESTANLTCFTHQAHDDRVDSFCIGGPADYEPTQKTLGLDCVIGKLDGEDLAHNVPQFSRFPTYWYNTGPRAIFRQHVKLQRITEADDHTVSGGRGFLLLVQREDNNQNMWHTMMEIMSLTLSLDVLRTNVNPSTGHPFFADVDVKSSRVVLLDTLADGPYYDLWAMFSGVKSARVSELSAAEVAGRGIIVPLPGGSNPFWQGDWVDIECGESALLKAYAHRVLDFYKVAESPPRSERKLRLTIVDRKQKRRLLNQDKYFPKIQAKYPQIDMKVVDYATLSLSGQIKISHYTDILVGVHGAGLTHGMFLPPQSTIVEILPPALDHKGFRNMARFLGHNHFSRHGSVHELPDSTGDWQHDDVFLTESEFMGLIDEAISSALHGAS